MAVPTSRISRAPVARARIASSRPTSGSEMGTSSLRRLLLHLPQQRVAGRQETLQVALLLRPQEDRGDPASWSRAGPLALLAASGRPRPCRPTPRHQEMFSSETERVPGRPEAEVGLEQEPAQAALGRIGQRHLDLVDARAGEAGLEAAAAPARSARSECRRPRTTSVPGHLGLRDAAGPARRCRACAGRPRGSHPRPTSQRRASTWRSPPGSSGSHCAEKLNRGPLFVGRRTGHLHRGRQVLAPADRLAQAVQRPALACPCPYSPRVSAVACRARQRAAPGPTGRASTS